MGYRRAFRSAGVGPEKPRGPTQPRIQVVELAAQGAQLARDRRAPRLRPGLRAEIETTLRLRPLASAVIPLQSVIRRSKIRRSNLYSIRISLIFHLVDSKSPASFVRRFWSNPSIFPENRPQNPCNPLIRLTIFSVGLFSNDHRHLIDSNRFKSRGFVWLCSHSLFWPSTAWRQTRRLLLPLPPGIGPGVKNRNPHLERNEAIYLSI